MTELCCGPTLPTNSAIVIKIFLPFQIFLALVVVIVVIVVVYIVVVIVVVIVVDVDVVYECENGVVSDHQYC